MKKATQLQNTSKTGSQDYREPVFLVIGRLQRPHGIHGEITMSVDTDFPERVKPGIEVFVGSDHTMMSIRSVRPLNKGLLIGFEGVDNREQIGLLRGEFVWVRRDDRPDLPEGEYYHHELIGMNVRQNSGELLGQVVEILVTGANDVYIVRTMDEREVLLPAIDEVVKSIDLDLGEIIVDLIPGLLD